VAPPIIDPDNKKAPSPGRFAATLSRKGRGLVQASLLPLREKDRMRGNANDA